MKRTLAGVVLCVVALTLAQGCEDDDNVAGPTLVATCEARPASGTAPLPVTFLVGVSGADGSYSVSVNYGDGSSGANPDLAHTYAGAGSYLASFTITTPTQSAACSSTVTVAPAPPAPPPPNRPPNAVFRTDPVATGNHENKISGTAPLQVHFNVCQSTDPDGDLIHVKMDLDADRRYESGGTTDADCRRDWTYAEGFWKPRVCVRDQDASGQPLHTDNCLAYEVTASR
jgi:hypothetical protein